MHKNQPEPNIEDVNRMLDYDPVSGIFKWKITGHAVHAGMVAGSLDKCSGYRRISVKGVTYRASHLAWFICKGEWPRLIDHKDTDRGNDAILNLRKATMALNSANQGPRFGRTYKGVYLTADGKYMARITVNYKKHYLGLFDDQESASRAYRDAAISHVGEFARWK